MACTTGAALRAGGSLPEPEQGGHVPFTLSLEREIVLNSFAKKFLYWATHLIARVLPAAMVYGGTACLIVCAICRYRWGLLLSLTMYTAYTFISCSALLMGAVVGLFKIWQSSRIKWHSEYARWCDAHDVSGEMSPLTSEWNDADVLDWHDVVHIVMLPSYRTPVSVLEDTLQAAARFRSARTHLGICLAFEEREEGARQKADALESAWGDRFRFLRASFHPSGLPQHIPGKSSNECWAFAQLCHELQERHGLSTADPRVILTVIDDDSELHERYFEALTYAFLTTPVSQRYLRTWQPPICHFKNYLRQPLLVRVSAMFATLSELSCLANPYDCHVNYSSYSLSLALATSVGGWDPDYLAEDWHMYAKCALKTEGRVRCEAIFLPLLNYTPEEDSSWATMVSRWDQARRHALGVSEVVYVISALCLGALEIRGWLRRFVFLWRLLPVLGKFVQVHLMNAMSLVVNVLAQVVIHFYMWRSWCYMSSWRAMGDEEGACELLGQASSQAGMAQDQILVNSLLVHMQQHLAAGLSIAVLFSAGLGIVYFELVRERVEGDASSDALTRSPLLHGVYVVVAASVVGWLSTSIYGVIPTWMAVYRIIWDTRFKHVVAGMAGRPMSHETAD